MAEEQADKLSMQAPPAIVARIIADEMVNELHKCGKIPNLYALGDEDEQLVYSEQAQRYYDKYFGLVMGLISK